MDKRQDLSDQIEQLEQEKASIEQQVKLEMQDAAYGTAPGYKVSWVSSESKRVDSQRLKKEQPDIFNRYSKNVSSRRFTIIHQHNFCTSIGAQNLRFSYFCLIEKHNTVYTTIIVC